MDIPVHQLCGIPGTHCKDNGGGAHQASVAQAHAPSPASAELDGLHAGAFDDVCSGAFGRPTQFINEDLPAAIYVVHGVLE
jgi:hypothetical protein